MSVIGPARSLSPSFSLWITVWLALIDLLQGCSGNMWHRPSTFVGDDRYVTIVATTEASSDSPVSPLAHPIVLPEANWAGMLGNIYVRPRRRWITLTGTTSDPMFAFSEVDQQYLAHHLAEAFSRAKPSEWVAFYLAHTQGPDVTEITSGAFFAQNGFLHLLIANYRYVVTVPVLQQEIRDRPLRPKGESFYEFDPRVRQSVVTEHPLGLPKPLMAEFRELLVEMDELFVPNGATRTGGEPSKATKNNSGEPVTPLEERLRTLDRLRSQGLITEEEYKLKRQQLLDQL